MRLPAPHSIAALGLAAGIAAGTVLHGQDPAPEAAVRRYVEDYQRQLSGVVGEERQSQREVRADGSVHNQRDLVADLLLVKAGNVPRMFRDVIAVDGKPIPNRADRLRRLFIDSRRDAVDQAIAISRESLRYNLGPTRILDTLMLPMTILIPFPAPRFRFTASDTGLRFEEIASPSMIRAGTPGRLADLPLRG
jgi:hypothetical protein